MRRRTAFLSRIKDQAFFVFVFSVFFSGSRCLSIASDQSLTIKLFINVILRGRSETQKSTSFLVMSCVCLAKEREIYPEIMENHYWILTRL